MATVLSTLVVSLSGCSGSGDGLTAELIPVKTSKQGNWSMLSPDGTIVYDGEFKHSPTVCFNGVFTVENSNGGYTLYTAGDKVPEEIPGCDSLICAGVMVDDLMPVTFADSRITLINKKGEKKVELTPQDGLEVVASFNHFESGLLGVKLESNKWGYVDKSGKIAIKAKYSDIQAFAEGYAIVTTKEEGSDAIVEVINTKGETVYKIKDKYQIVSNFSNGRLIVMDEDHRYSVLDEKGEATKLPDKIDDVEGFHGDYIIFESDDNQTGVMDIKGEVVIRPKYRAIIFCTDNTFWAQKDRDSEIVKLDNKGETIVTTDFKSISMHVPGIGFFAKDGGTYVLINEKGELQGKEEFYEYSLDDSASDLIRTDYFDFSGTTTSVADMISVNGACGLTFGMTPDKVFKDEEPSYTSEYSKDLTSKKVDSFFASFIPVAGFNGRVTEWQNGEYIWNPQAKLIYVGFGIKANRELNKENYDAMVKAITAKGFKLVKSGTAKDVAIKMTLLQKGNAGFLVQHRDGSDIMVAMVFSTTLDPTGFNDLKAMIIGENGTSEQPVADSAAVETQTAEAAPTSASSDGDYRALVTSRKLTPSDLSSYSKAQLRLMRNTIYAIHGRKFTSQDLQQYFSKFSWYHPTVTDVPNSALSEIEKYNVTLIQKYE